MRKQDFIDDITAATGLNQECVIIRSITPGSVIISFELRPPDSSDASPIDVVRIV